MKVILSLKTFLPHWGKSLALLAVILLVSSCAYRHYLGIHGPSVKKFPDIHADYTADASCLMCHRPGSSVNSPKTGHPQFKGCLKCHNDDLASRLGDSPNAPTGYGHDQIRQELKT